MAAEKILQEALALPPEDRVRIANALYESVGPDDEEMLDDDAWEKAWAVEVERRIKDLDEGRTTAISYEEFKSRVRARLSQP
jgi:putative addiction module component (TIGR02574 family)